MYFRTLSALLVVTTAIACEAPSEALVDTTPKLGVLQQAIRDGREDHSHPGVVGVLAQHDQGMGLCTGSLIAPNLVLTAHHCVAPVHTQFVVCGESSFGDVYEPHQFHVTTAPRVQQGAEFYGVREVIVTADRVDNCGHDIALLVLDQNIRGEVAPVMRPNLDAFPQNGDNFTAIGYGHTGNHEGAGVRRIVSNKEVLCSGDSCERMAPGVVTRTEIIGNEGTCQGDSGGPALDAQGRVLGALSRGGEGCVFPVYSSVYAWADWLRAGAVRAAHLGGYHPPSWVNTAADQDADGIEDASDNCPGQVNAGQADLDEDGQGDACDASVDRDCAVCEACDADVDCGPGSVCGVAGLCVMTCTDDSQCPGDGTSVCRNDGICVNVDFAERGVCHEDFVCGEWPEEAPVEEQVQEDEGDEEQADDIDETDEEEHEADDEDEGEEPVDVDPVEAPTSDDTEEDETTDAQSDDLDHQDTVEGPESDDSDEAVNGSNNERQEPDLDQEVELVEIVGEDVDGERQGNVASGGCDASGHSQSAQWPLIGMMIGLGFIGRRRRN